MADDEAIANRQAELASGEEYEDASASGARAKKCRAVENYTAKGDDELSFKKGDTLFVHKRIKGARWEGVHDGKVGWFPKIYVDELEVSVKQGAGETARVRALRDHEAAEGSGELSFPKDAVIFVVGQEGNYWKGVYGGKAGNIPMGAVENANKAKKEDVVAASKRCTAVKEHVGSDASQLSFAIGDVIFVPKADESLETWQGVSKGQVGTFPRTHVVISENKEVVDAAIASAKAESADTPAPAPAPAQDKKAAKAAEKEAKAAEKEAKAAEKEAKAKAKEETKKTKAADAKAPAEAPATEDTPQADDAAGEEDEDEATGGDEDKAEAVVAAVAAVTLDPKKQAALDKKAAKAAEKEAKAKAKEEAKRLKAEAKAAKKK